MTIIRIINENFIIIIEKLYFKNQKKESNRIDIQAV